MCFKNKQKNLLLSKICITNDLITETNLIIEIAVMKWLKRIPLTLNPTVKIVPFEMKTH